MTKIITDDLDLVDLLPEHLLPVHLYQVKMVSALPDPARADVGLLASEIFPVMMMTIRNDCYFQLVATMVSLAEAAVLEVPRHLEKVVVGKTVRAIAEMS